MEVDFSWIAANTGSREVVGRGSTVFINFYRIDVVQSGDTQYSSWHPTGKEPPCFHVPSSFGKFVIG